MSARPAALRLAPYRLFLALTLLVLAFAVGPAHAQRVIDEAGGPWGAPAGADPCMAEDDLARRLADDPALAARRELFERLVEEATRQKLIGDVTQAGPSYTIPVAVHIVHMGGIENISDQQVLSQIHALNRDFADSLGNGAPAVNTQISFCLAQNLPSASSVTWSCAWTRTATAWRTRPQRTGSSSARAALAGPGALQVDFAGLPRGLYFLRLVTEDGAAARRVTVIR